MHQPRKVRTSSIFAFAAAMGLALAPISVTYAQAQQAAAVQSISARDKAEGAKVHPQLLAEFGGAATGPQCHGAHPRGREPRGRHNCRSTGLRCLVCPVKPIEFGRIVGFSGFSGLRDVSGFRL